MPPDRLLLNGTRIMAKNKSCNVKKHRPGPPKSTHSATGLSSDQKLSSLPKTDLHPGQNEKYFQIIVIVILLAFGTYHSILYWRHQVVPNSDFPAFVSVGHSLLSFELPGSFKRAPVLGLLQAALSHLVGGQHPDLTAGCLLNAILHPLNLLLLYILGRKLLGQAALWLAIIVAINPWNLSLLADPIAETTLLFFCLLTFYFMFRRSNWVYLFAAITTMARYEGAALILIAFVLDMIYRKTKKEKIQALAWSALAALPLAMWMLLTFLNWDKQGGTHYLKEAGWATEGKFLFTDFIKLGWEVTFEPLLTTISDESGNFVTALTLPGKIIAVASMTYAAIWGLLKRQWEITALLTFLLIYICVHAWHGVVYSRFCATVAWIPLLFCIYAWRNICKSIPVKGKSVEITFIILQCIVIVIAVVCLWRLFPDMSRYAPLSPGSTSLPYVALAVIVLILAVRACLFKTKGLIRNLSISAVVALIIVTNQFSVLAVVSDGQRQAEFKKLADWYIANAQPGEKMLTTLPHVVRLFAPKYSSRFNYINSIKADSPEKFAEKCYRENVTYVTWDSVGGSQTKGSYYERWGYKNITMLAQPRDIGPYQFVEQITAADPEDPLYQHKRGIFINIFRLRPRQPTPDK